MQHYPNALKITLIQKLLTQPGRSIRSIAREAGVSKTALYEWITDYHNRNNIAPHISSQEWPLPQRLKAIAECSQLDEMGIGKHCRRHGIYRKHLEQWKISLMDEHETLEWEKIKAKNKGLYKQNVKLERALKRSQKLLVEAKALLELKKSSCPVGEKRGQLKRFARLILKRLRNILAWFKYPISNGKAEGIHNMIKTRFKRAYGYKNVDYMHLKVLQKCGLILKYATHSF